MVETLREVYCVDRYDPQRKHSILAIALVTRVIVRQFSGDDTAVGSVASEEASILQDSELPEAESYCEEAQENYDNVMDMYSDRGSSDIMEQALEEAEKQVSILCDG